MIQTPQYRVLEEAFFAPDLVSAGSIIATDAPPGPHLEPWNDEAKARFEEWYNEEVPEKDAKTGDPTGKMLKPHAKYRVTEYRPTAQQTAVVLEPPEPADVRGKTLAEVMIPKATDQRPPASRRFAKVSPMEAQSNAARGGVVDVIVPAPAASTVKGGPGT